jgi:hypothetical protein
MGLKFSPPRTAASFPRADASRHRRPLGLAPAPGSAIDDAADERAADSARRDIGAEVDEMVRTMVKTLGGEARCRAQTANLMDGLATLSAALKAAYEGDDDLYSAAKVKFAEQQTKIVGLETEIARLRATVAEAQSKVNELAFVSERLRVENKGPHGLPGPMGRDGHNGAPVPRGERGERGDQGRPAPVVAAWSVDERAFTATPLTGEGKPAGAVLHLRGLFEAFNDAINDADDAEEIDAARAMRDEVERQAANVREGRPAR